MTPGQFDRICQQKGLRLIEKISGPEQIYIAEGYKDWHPNYEGPHMLVLWAIGTDEKMDLAREIHCPLGKTQWERRQEAKFDAEWHREMSRLNKRFEAQGIHG